MNPREFEELVCEYFRKQGYEVNITPYSNDYGVDVFASKGKEKLAIQAKMYGNSTRRINRQCVMELYGAKDFFDCTKAIIVTDGVFMPDALVVAKKLKVEVLLLNDIPAESQKVRKRISGGEEITFEKIWENHIVPLQGKIIIRDNGETNHIIKADWSEVVRLTSNGNKGKIKIEIFKQAVIKLLADGEITRDHINQNYIGRASSGVILILSQVPFFMLTKHPVGLKYQKE